MTGRRQIDIQHCSSSVPRDCSSEDSKAGAKQLRGISKEGVLERHRQLVKESPGLFVTRFTRPMGLRSETHEAGKAGEVRINLSVPRPGTCMRLAREWEFRKAAGTAEDRELEPYFEETSRSVFFHCENVGGRFP